MSIMTLLYYNAIGKSAFSAKLRSLAQIEKFPIEVGKYYPLGRGNRKRQSTM